MAASAVTVGRNALGECGPRCDQLQSGHLGMGEAWAVAVVATPLRHRRVARRRLWRTCARDMRKGGESSDGIGLCAVISACERSGQRQRVLSLLSETHRACVSPDVISWSVAICACEGCGQWQQALSLPRERYKVGVSSYVISSNAAISACEKGKQWRRELSLVKEMCEKGIGSEVIVFNAAISARVESDQGQRAWSLLDDMQGGRGAWMY